MCACVCVYSLTVLPIGLFPRSFLIHYDTINPAFVIQKPPVEPLT